MIKSRAVAFQARQRFDELRLDRWRADTGQLTVAAVEDLKRRERIFFWWRLLKLTIRFPSTFIRTVINLVLFAADLDRLHAEPRRKMRMGEDCVVDRNTWLVNGQNIVLGNHVKISTFSVFIAGFTAKIYVGDYVLVGPGVFVVAANHGAAMTGVPIRDQPWEEKDVTIRDGAWIGANAVILPGVTIGAGAIVAAGSVITADVPDGMVVHGSTKNVFKRRN